MNPRLRFSESEIHFFAARYQYSRQEPTVLGLKETVIKRGWMKKDDLKIVAQWKAPRSAGHVEENTEDYVKEITSFALAAKTERARIEVLTNLNGVRWPTASVILHFFHIEDYPIMDFRALWSVSLDVPNQYSFDFWWPYVEYCRTLSKNNSLDMRTLDRALWQYSKENQKDA